MIVSFSRCNNNEYEKSLLPAFDKRIEITDEVDNREKILHMKMYNQPFKRKVKKMVDSIYGES